MRFLADECCDAALVDALRSDGHDILYAIESLRGATDDSLLARALFERRILLTEDKDFGELVYRLRRPTHGIVLLRFDVADRALKIPRLRYLLEQEAERLSGAFVVLEADKVRIRPLAAKPPPDLIPLE
jgi:predicted nuclease of predicted toxin-antitoxin system